MPDRIEKSVVLRASPSRVWRALTSSDEFGTWFRAALEGPLVLGAWVHGRITYEGYEHLPFHARVVAMEPERYFAFRWPHADADVPLAALPTTLVEFRLEALPEGTRLTVVESGFDALPVARRAEAIRSNDEGWGIQMENVRQHVDG
jgi:uncharacterized protein YndB with AHSA1/START domain